MYRVARLSDQGAVVIHQQPRFLPPLMGNRDGSRLRPDRTAGERCIATGRDIRLAFTFGTLALCPQIGSYTLTGNQDEEGNSESRDRPPYFTLALEHKLPSRQTGGQKAKPKWRRAMSHMQHRPHDVPSSQQPVLCTR